MIDKNDVLHVANLARLEFSDEDAKKFTSQLGRILTHAQKISELDTSKVEPTSHAVELKNVFREDGINNEVSVDKALKNAPEKDGGAFKVPRIV